MCARELTSTRVTLLARLREETPDAEAWSEFVGTYGPAVLGWCRRFGLQQADAEDVTQTVLLRLARRMKTFAYDEGKSFRAYLRTVTRYALNDFLAEKTEAGSGDTALMHTLQSVAAREELETRLDGLFDRELLDEAMTRVRRRVEPHTWAAFESTAFGGLSGAEAAEALGMKVATVFKAKSKVVQAIREELARLEPDREHLARVADTLPAC